MAHATPESSGFRMDTSLAQSKVASSTSTKVAFTARIPRCHGLISTRLGLISSRLGIAGLFAAGTRVLCPGVADYRRLPARPISLALPFIYQVRPGNAILSRWGTLGLFLLPHTIGAYCPLKLTGDSANGSMKQDDRVLGAESWVPF